MAEEMVDCDRCSGTGTIVDNIPGGGHKESTCPDCNGTKKVKKK